MRIPSLIPIIAIVFGVAAQVQAQSDPTTYSYDSVGDRLEGTKLVRMYDARVISFQPSTSLHDQPVNIFGRNLPVADPGGVSVTIGGVAAPILSVAPNVITIKVPQGAATGSLVVTLPSQPPVDLGTIHIEGIIINPRAATISLSQTAQFLGDTVGVEDQAVSWQVLPLPGGETGENHGTITPDGLYTPPPATELNAAGQVLIKATSTENPRLSTTAIVTLFDFVQGAPPASTVRFGVPGAGEPGSGISVGQPPASTLLLAPTLEGDVGSGVIVSQPPVSAQHEDNP